MKKPHIDEVSMTFTGPVAMMEQALAAMHSLGFEEIEQASSERSADGSIPWRESEFFKDVHVGTYLSGARYREDITQVELAERTGIQRRHISEMENGKRPIGKATARKLAKALNIDPRILLSI
jgi:DNA-binding XRE family transcriptional regulator